MEETRSCSKCSETKPLSEYYYIKQENRYNKQCKSCKSDASKLNYQTRKTHTKIVSTEKTCTTCNILKPITDYYKQSKQIDGHSNVCIECHKSYHLEYRKKSSPKYLNPLPEGHKKCNHCHQILPVSNYNKIWKDKPQLNPYCKSCNSIKHQEWSAADGKKWHNEYKKQKNHNDPQFKLAHTLRGRYLDALKRHTSGGRVNKHHSAIELIGCPIGDYVTYLEKQFHPDMNWGNHGSIWEIDHIMPVSSFDLTSPDEQKKCFHYTNTQPLFKSENRSKGNKII
jgi:hypothetical protein